MNVMRSGRTTRSQRPCCPSRASKESSSASDRWHQLQQVQHLLQIYTGEETRQQSSGLLARAHQPTSSSDSSTRFHSKECSPNSPATCRAPAGGAARDSAPAGCTLSTRSPPVTDAHRPRRSSLLCKPVDHRVCTFLSTLNRYSHAGMNALDETLHTATCKGNVDKSENFHN